MVGNSLFIMGKTGTWGALNIFMFLSHLNFAQNSEDTYPYFEEVNIKKIGD